MWDGVSGALGVWRVWVHLGRLQRWTEGIWSVSQICAVVS